jgi:hypothetical protein
MRKWLNDLSYDETKELVNRFGTELQQKVFDHALDDAYYRVGEYLNNVPHRDVDYMYFDRGEHFTVKDVTDAFMSWVDKVQEDYEWLNDDTYKKCKRAYELWKADKYERDLTDDEWKEYDDLKDEIGDEIFALMKSEYDAAFDDDYMVEVFDNYTDEFIDNPDDTWVDTETWEIHDINDEEDEENEGLDYDLDEQLELPTL